MKATALLTVLAILTVCGSALADTGTQSVESRLAIPVTMDCVGVRLHDVTERLAAETSLDIKCGSNKDDYTCRDIPVFLSVKELPLGVMLRTLADVTHLELAKGKIGEKTYYRIYRDPKRTRLLTNYFEGRKQAGVDAARWDWDTLAAAGSLPIPDPVKNPREASAVALANLVSNLGPSARDRVLAGEPVTIKPDEMPDSIRKALRANAYAMKVSMSLGDGTPGVSEPGDATVTLSMPDQPGSGGLSVKMQQTRTSDEGRRVWGSWTMVSSAEAQVFGGLYTDSKQITALRQSRPRPPDPPREPESVSSRYSNLGDDKDLMDKTVKLVLPKDVKDVTPSTITLALSKALGYSIIYEDYASHRSRNDDRMRAIFGKETKVRDILFRSASSGWYYVPRWRIDAKSKLIIGTDWGWVDRYANMVPADVIDYLAARLNGDGVSFEDLSFIAGLTQGQYQEWISDDKTLQPLRGFSYNLSFEPMWRLYFALPASQQSRMASSIESLTADQQKEFWRYGLPLAEVNQGLIAEARAKYLNQSMPVGGLDDPAASRTTLRLVSQQNQDGSHDGYRLITTWLEDGAPKGREPSIWDHFPIYSPEREAEIKKAKEAAAKVPAR